MTLHWAPVSSLNVVPRLFSKTVVFQSFELEFASIIPMNISSDGLSQSSCTMALRLDKEVLDLQTFAKWFFRPHLRHSTPYAGHVWFGVCLYPHLLQAGLSICFLAADLIE